jgi:hypothetical protein
MTSVLGEPEFLLVLLVSLGPQECINLASWL